MRTSKPVAAQKEVGLYLTRKSALPRMRAYRDELADLYLGALRRRDYRDARRLFDLRRRVTRWVLNYEEWHVD
jgi:hypothetical protein